MKDKTKDIAFILIAIFIFFSLLNIYKFFLKDKINKTPSSDIYLENDEMLVNVINNLKQVKALNIEKEVNKNSSKQVMNEDVKYSIDLNKRYISGMYNEQDFYVLKDNNKYYSYKSNSWINTNGYQANETYYDDYYLIIELLKKIKSYKEQDDGTYKLNIDIPKLKKYFKLFTKGDVDPTLPEILWITDEQYSEINYDKINVYITLTDDKNYLKEIIFDLTEMYQDNSCYYAIYYTDYNDVNVVIPTDVLANLF